MENTHTQDFEFDFDFCEQFAGMKGTALSPEYLIEIGNIVVCFSLLEYEVFLLIHGLLRTPEKFTRIITSELPFRTLVDISSSLIKQIHGESIFEVYKKIIAIVTEAEDNRNMIVHSYWGSAQKHVIRTKITSKKQKGLNFIHQKYTLEDLSNVGLKISKAILCIERFRKQLGYTKWV